MAWDEGGTQVSARLCARLTDDPRFPRAVRALATNMLCAGAENAALDGIFKDAGRYVAAMLAIHLHFSGGLTLPRLKAACTQSGLLSPGRARALLLYLRYLGYIEPLLSGLRDGPARYTPTVKCLSAWRGHLRAALEAARIIEPDVDHVLERFDEAAVFETFARLESQGLLDAARTTDQSMAYFRVFMHRHAGTQIVWHLLTTSGDEAFPPRSPIPFSIGMVAQRFRVSRIHVKRLLADAQREGLLHHDENGTVAFSARGRSELQFVYSTQLIRLLIASARTIRAMAEIAPLQTMPSTQAGVRPPDHASVV